MMVHYVNYSELWFRRIRKGDLPSVRSGKFILVTDGSSQWAVFSPAELSAYHAVIAERFLRRGALPDATTRRVRSPAGRERLAHFGRRLVAL